MVFPIVGGDGKPTGYEIENSLMFNDGDKHYLERAFDSGGSRRTFTVSAWVKRCELGANNPVWAAAPSNGGQCSLQFNSSDQLVLREYNTSDEEVMNLVTDASFRDVSAWYHIVAAVDTTQSTSSNRAKLYVNGSLQSLGTASYPNQNYDLLMNSTTNTGKFFVGTETYTSVNVVFDGYMSEFYIINNSQLAPTSFAETNDDGEWIPKDASGDLTFGQNGVYLEFKQTSTSQNATGIGADTSGEGHHFAVANNNNPFDQYDIMTDTPTNNFPTWNFLQQNAADPISGFGQGNLSVTESSNADWSTCTATQAVANGKWYWEVKINNLSGSVMLGVLRQEYASTTLAKTSNAYMGSNSGDLSFSYRENGTFYFNGSTDTGNTSFSNDTIMLALDMDNGAIYTGKNGTWNDSGDPTSGASKTGASYTGISAGEFYSPATSMSSSDIDCILNAGQSNGVNVISSANADANGHGAFEYSVPSGYFAICTKNIAEQA